MFVLSNFGPQVSTSQDILSLGVMEASPVKVAIIGAGLGGLTLAKTLVEGSGVEAGAASNGCPGLERSSP